MTAATTTRRNDAIRFARSLTGAFGVEITPVKADAPANVLKVKIALPSRDVEGGPDGQQVDYVFTDTDVEDNRTLAMKIRQKTQEMLLHEYDEWFAAGGQQLFPPSHDPAVLGSMRHWTIPNNCAKDEAL